MPGPGLELRYASSSEWLMLQHGDNLFRRLFEAFLKALSFECAVLFQQLRAEPAQGPTEDEHDAKEDHQDMMARPDPLCKRHR